MAFSLGRLLILDIYQGVTKLHRKSAKQHNIQKSFWQPQMFEETRIGVLVQQGIEDLIDQNSIDN